MPGLKKTGGRKKNDDKSDNKANSGDFKAARKEIMPAYGSSERIFSNEWRGGAYGMGRWETATKLAEADRGTAGAICHAQDGGRMEPGGAIVLARQSCEIPERRDPAASARRDGRRLDEIMSRLAGSQHHGPCH